MTMSEDHQRQSDKPEVSEILPPVPENMSFSKNEFCGDTFSVDNFVKRHRKDVNLEQLREDLSAYLRSLRLTMIDLINEDYTDFVNLSSNLIGLDKSIGNVRLPLKTLNDEIAAIHQQFENVIRAVVEKRKHLYNVRLKRRDLQRIIKAAKILNKIEEIGDPFWNNPQTFPMDVLTRFALQINEVSVELDCTAFQTSLVDDELKPKAAMLSHRINAVLDDVCRRAIESCATEQFISCMKIYKFSGRIRELEKLITSHSLRPSLSRVITPENLENKSIFEFFNDILELVTNKCAVLLQATVDLTSLYLNSVWKEIVDGLIIRTPLLFSPGNPDLFYIRYMATKNFLEKFRDLTRIDDETLKSSEKYGELIEKFNLTVYFHLRYQEIGSKFEQVLQGKNLNVSTPASGSGETLVVVSCLQDLVESCWSQEKIFIPELFHAFWRLTLRLLSRYCVWLKSLTIPDAFGSGIDGFECSRRLYTLLVETHRLTEVVEELFRNRIADLKPATCSQDELQLCLSEAMTVIKTQGAGHVESLLKDHLIHQCTEILKQISDIPRLYRKTNREAPNRASPYVSACVDVLRQFLYYAYQKPLWNAEITLEILNQITKNFQNSTTEVLTSVQKMEDSLRRLKKIKGASASQKSNSSVSDDDKIRLQLYIDVNAYADLIESSLQISKDTVVNLQHLINLVKNARNTA